MCWCQASLDAKGTVTVLAPYLERVHHHQLFFAWMQKPRQPGRRVGKRGRRPLRPQQPPVPAANPATGCIQLRFFDDSRDFTRFDRLQHGNLTNPWLLWAQHVARRLGEARGWTKWVVSDVDRALVILLSQHIEGETIRYSELLPALRAHGLNAKRTVEVIDRIGLFEDDREPSFDRWIERKIANVAPGIRQAAETWARQLCHGGPRSQPRALSTCWNYLNKLQPIMLAWSDRYDHLREVTREDIVAVRDDVLGKQRENRLAALRSLFRHAKKTGAIFRDPTSRVRVGCQSYAVLQPLPSDNISRPSLPSPPRRTGSSSPWLPSTPPGRERSVNSSWTTSTSATGASSWPGTRARWTTSPTEPSSAGWNTAAPAGPTPPIPTC